MKLPGLYSSFKILFTVGVFAVFALIVDWQEFIQRFKTVDPVWLLAGVGFMLGQSVLATVRWYLLINMLMRYHQFWHTVLIYHAAVFVNQVLPASVGGDVMRIAWLKESGVPGSVCATSVFFERLGMLGALTVAVLIAQGLLIEQSDVPGTFMLILPVVIVLVVVGTAVLIPLFERILLAMGRKKIAEWFASTLILIRGHIKDPRFLALSPALGVSGVLMFCGVLFSASLMVDVSIGPSEAITITLGGWGAREGAVASLFVMLGHTITEGVLVGFGVSFIVLLSSLPGGVALLVLNRNLKKLIIRP
jgi:uncharacterized membrane protein YbhN (UPF0104 family)